MWNFGKQGRKNRHDTAPPRLTDSGRGVPKRVQHGSFRCSCGFDALAVLDVDERAEAVDFQFEGEVSGVERLGTAREADGAQVSRQHRDEDSTTMQPINGGLVMPAPLGQSVSKYYMAPSDLSFERFGCPNLAVINATRTLRHFSHLRRCSFSPSVAAASCKERSNNRRGLMWFIGLPKCPVTAARGARGHARVADR